MDIKQILKQTIEESKRKKAEEESDRQKRNDSDRTAILSAMSGDISKSLQAILPELTKSAQISEDTIRKALSEAIQINMPELEIPEIQIPDIHIDTREFSAIASRIEKAISSLNLKEPKVTYTPQSVQFPDRFNVSLPDYDKLKPLPVMMMDTKGNPMQFPGGGGGGKSDFFTVKGITNTIGIVSINPDGSPAGAGSVASSVSVSDIFGSTGTGFYNGDNRLRVSLETGGSGLTDAELRATSLTTQQLSGAIDSVSVTNTVTVTGTLTSTGAYLLNGDGTYRDSMPITGTVTGITNSIAVANTDSTGVQYSGSNPFPFRIVTDATATVNAVIVDSAGAYRSTFPVSGTVTVSSITATSAASIVDSTGIQYSGSNPVPVTIITQPLASTIAVGSVVADAVDDGSAPVQGGGIARTANPTAVAGGDVVKSTYDDLGRQVTRPLQVRDLIATAYVSVTNGTETTLRAAVAGASLDMVLLTLSNTSDAAVTADIRAVTAGNISLSIVVPPYGTAGYSASVPLPQSEQGNNWTIDLPDITGTTVYASGIFSQEV